MKIGLYADPHFSRSSSIITGKSGQFTGRLDNLINSFEWMDKLFCKERVTTVFCLGDLVDKPVLNSEEITAMSKCNLNNHYIVLGNHCRSDKDGSINSISNFENVLNKNQFLCEGIYILPYNHDLTDLKSISPRPKIILSHNDIKGCSINGYVMSSGYEIPDILESCDLFINGHIHNGGWVVKGRILNLGIISGMNFSSCCGEWNPSVAIVDTETLEVSLYENPVAFKFKKVEFDTLPKLKGFISNLQGDNYVLQVKVPERISQSARKLVDQSDKIYSSRILVYREKEEVSKQELIDFKSSEDIVSKFRRFIGEQNPKYDKGTINLIINEISQMTDGES